MATPCPLLGDGIMDDTLLHVAGFLPTTKDPLCLMLISSRFAAKIIATAPSGAGGADCSGSAGDAVHRGGGGAAVGSGVQRAWVGASP